MVLLINKEVNIFAQIYFAKANFITKLAKSGFGLEYPYKYTCHITIEQQQFRLYKECKDKLIKELQKLKAQFDVNEMAETGDCETMFSQELVSDKIAVEIIENNPKVKLINKKSKRSNRYDSKDRKVFY